MKEVIHKVDFWRWPNFKPVEVLSPVGLEQYRAGNLMIQPFAMDYLQAFRDWLKVRMHQDVRIICNFGTLKLRGFRSISENAGAGGCKTSRHMQGIAFDVHSPDIDVIQLKKAAVDFAWGAVGIYSTKGFVHLDCRAVLNGTIAIFGM